MEQLTTRQKSISTMLQTGHAPNSCSEQRTRLIKSLTQDLAQSWDKGTTPTTTQCPQPTASLSTHKNSNRTTSTITNPTINNGTPVTTTYCYNNADQLISSSLVAIGTPEYDDHGNTTKLGAGTTQQLEFTYDATDKNTQILQINPTTANGQVSQYERDVQGRITKRKTFTITNSNWNQTNETTYGFTGAGDTPDFTRDNTNTITEKYLQLPGNVLVTIRPNEPLTNNKTTYSLPNIHSDIFATTNAAGTITNTYTTGPFGEALNITGSNQTLPILPGQGSNTTPNNSTPQTTYCHPLHIINTQSKPVCL